MKEVDPNKIVAEVISDNLDTMIEAAQATLKGAKNTIRARFRKTYKTYVERVLDRHSRAKSFYVRSEPVPLYDFFVPPDLSTQRRTLSKPSIRDLIDVNSAIVIAGTGGSGKSMLLRHLLISTLIDTKKTPIFFELRQLPKGAPDLRAALLSTLRNSGLDVDDQFLEMTLDAGNHCLLLDGFDELDLEHREPIATEIQHLRERYPKNWIVLTSRPDHRLEGWEEFVVFEVEPFDLERAIELLEKLPADPQVRGKLVNDLRAGLYQKHKSFLSNPLLLSIMLLTYTDTAHIPDKVSLFYGQAYESLFQKHDAFKGGFMRQRSTNLDIQDFGAAFAAFCLFSYDVGDFSFSREKALAYFDRAQALTGLSFNGQGILDDTIQAVCLLVEDGLELTFSHRSFQEYFVARFVSQCDEAVKKQLIKRYAIRRDSVLKLLFEIDQTAVEEHFILPGLSKLEESIGLRKKVGKTHHLRFLKVFVDSFELGTSESMGVRSVRLLSGELVELIFFIKDNYPFEVPVTAWEEAEEKVITALGTYRQRPTKITAGSLKTTDAFFLAQYESPDVLGRAFCQHLFTVGAEIRARHAEARASLRSILSQAPHSTD